MLGSGDAGAEVTDVGGTDGDGAEESAVGFGVSSGVAVADDGSVGAVDSAGSDEPLLGVSGAGVGSAVGTVGVVGIAGLLGAEVHGCTWVRGTQV